MQTILLTGYSGLVGGAFLKQSHSRSYRVKLLGRAPVDTMPHYPYSLEEGQVPDEALEGVDVLVHCAARVHIMKDTTENPTEIYQKLNTQATIDLARAAAQAGVKRFIFMSTIKVNGESTPPGSAFDEQLSAGEPADPYGASKYAAEKGLLELAKTVSMDVVIIRTPLIYGPGVKGNLSSLISLIHKPLPIPLGCVRNNRRSLIALDNLVDFLLLCADYANTPQAANQVFVLADDKGISTRALLEKLAGAYQQRLWMLPVPTGLLQLLLILLGKKDFADRLLGSLSIDNTKARELLNWQPVSSMDEQLKKMASEDK